MKIVTAAEMGAADARSVEMGVPVAELMENAGAAVARFVLRRYAEARQVAVACGKGNNGGDGFVAARVLACAGRQVTVVLLGRAEELKGDARASFERMRSGAAGIAVVEAADDAALAGRAGVIDAADVIVDAVVGTGFKPPLRGVAVAARELVLRAKAMVVAVDVPSGWDADATAMHAQGAFRADAVVTFTAPKPAHVFGQMTGSWMGAVVVAGIGSPEAAVRSDYGLEWTGAAKAMTEKPRAVDSNKGRFGHVLVVAGSRGKSGAAAMASLAALRAGAGLVTAAVPASVLESVAGVTPELMTEALAEDAAGTLSLENLRSGALDALAKKMSVVAMGPGLSTAGDVPELVREFVTRARVPMVVDADALNAFDGRAKLLNGEGRVLVLTPHPGEMARLIGGTVRDVEADRVGIARRFAMEHKLTLVLKGWRTLVAHPDGRMAVNTSGNPAMAKGGSGDILTGIIAAMLGQYPEHAAEAVEAAVYLHGLAADLATMEMDEHTVLATDTLAHLSGAFRYRVRDEDGLTWVAGVRG